MAENTEETITKSMENKMSSALEISSADDRAVSFDKKENHEQVDKLPASEEASEAIAEEEQIENTDLLSPEKQQDSSKTDCNGDLKIETDLDKTVTAETDQSETKESNSDELRPSEARSNDENYIYATTMQSNLNDILKIVPEDLAMEMLQNADESATAKDSDRENSEEQTVKKEDDISTDDTADGTKKCAASVAAKDKRDSRESLEKTEEKSNFGIVCSPTAIGELIEEQLANDSALSTDRTDHIVEWVKNSVKIKSNEESNIVEECKSENMNKAQKQKRLSVTPPFISLRKSQKLVSNIIKKSIKW